MAERLSGRADRKLQKQSRGECTESALHARFRMLVIFAVDLLSEVIVDPDLLDDVELRFQEVDVMLFVCKNFDQ